MIASTPATKRALICEDEGLTILTIKKALLRAGFEVVGEALDGAEAVRLAEALQPDFILMDITMPGPINGIEATRQIVEHRPVPIIMLTAYSDSVFVDEALAAGACGYLVKPIMSDLLGPVLQRALQRFQVLRTAIEEATDLTQALEITRLVDQAQAELMRHAGVSEKEAQEQLHTLRQENCWTMKQTALHILNPN